MKRGYSYAEAMAYVGVKRRTFDEKWRPRLVAIPQGSSLIFDRVDLDRLFDEFKQESAGTPEAANDAAAELAQNGPRNGRPITEKGSKQWANKPGASTPMAMPGKSTGGGAVRAFDSAASTVLGKRKAG